MEYIWEKQYIEKLPNGSFWYDEKVVFLIAYIDTHQKGSCLSEICVGVDNICCNKLWRNAEERFCLEILSSGQSGGNKNKPPSMINHMLPSLFLELVIVYPRKC